MSFEPIAIIGRSCVLPGAVSPEKLWDAVVQGRNLISPVPENRWGVSKHRILSVGDDDNVDKCWSDNGGYVSGFSDIFDPVGFRTLSVDAIQRLDPLFQWTLHTTRMALQQIQRPNPSRCGLVLGNLSSKLRRFFIRFSDAS